MKIEELKLIKALIEKDIDEENYEGISDILKYIKVKTLEKMDRNRVNIELQKDILVMDLREFLSETIENVRMEHAILRGLYRIKPSNNDSTVFDLVTISRERLLGQRGISENTVRYLESRLNKFNLSLGMSFTEEQKHYLEENTKKNM